MTRTPGAAGPWKGETVGASSDRSQQGDTEQTNVMSDHTSSGDERAATERGNRGNGDTGAESRREANGPAPPWQRTGAVGRPDPGASQAFDIGEPQHANRGTARQVRRDGSDRQGGAAAKSSVDGPTGFIAPVREPGNESGQAGGARFGRPAMGAPEPPSEQAASSPTGASMRVGPGRLPRRANLQLKSFDPWSVLKLSLVLSVAGFFVWLVAVVVLYAVLAAMGVWEQLNTTYAGLTAVQGGTDEALISFGSVFGAAFVVGLVNIVLFSAFATVAAYVYNVAADMTGGLELTLSERD